LDSVLRLGLALTSPIAIDRRRGVRALNRMAELGRERLAQGFWITIFRKERA